MAAPPYQMFCWALELSTLLRVPHPRSGCSSGEQFLLHLRIGDSGIREGILPAFMGEGEFGVIQAERLQQGRMQIVNADGVLDRLAAELIGRSMDISLLETA